MCSKLHIKVPGQLMIDVIKIFVVQIISLVKLKITLLVITA